MSQLCEAIPLFDKARWALLNVSIGSPSGIIPFKSFTVEQLRTKNIRKKSSCISGMITIHADEDSINKLLE
jgi:hypothetical protein